jgi:hypothetical protein
MAETYPNHYAGENVLASTTNAGLPKIAIKTADETVINSTSVQDDDQLFLSVAANATYAFTGWIWFSSPVTTVDLRAAFSLPSGATMFRSGMGQINGATTGNGVVDTSVLSLAGQEGRGAFGTSLAVHYAGYVVTAGTAGNLQFRWAQVVAGVDEIRVKAGSWIQLIRANP